MSFAFFTCATCVLFFGLGHLHGYLYRMDREMRDAVRRSARDKEGNDGRD